ncbi:hypothetical protein C804_05012 [Lachnospiraceae bacterium A4]|nr:hypothetical protein C804_05012 [Lachnospiraceae bacterium A4]
MKVLIVEDNKDKRNNIKNFLTKRIEGITFGEAKSYSSGISEIYDNKWDLIILDMTLPTYDISHTETGGEKKPVAGKEILRRMKNRKINTPTIIVTQFDVFGERQISLNYLNKEIEENYGHIWIGTVSYDKSTWQIELDKLINDLILQEEK